MTDQISYLDNAAATAVGLDYKRRSIAALDVRPGQTVADLGCGPGTDLGRLADAAGPDGTVLGIDRDPAMLAEAARRYADRPTVAVRVGDLHELPLADESLDRVRADRTLQHVDDPAKSLAEVRRVLRPGGLFAMAEPDWDTLAVADDDIEVSRGFARFLAGRVRNPTIGRELPRLCERAGLRVRAVEPIPALFRDFDTADRILGLRRNTARAVEAGLLASAYADPWLRRLASGPVVVGFMFYLVLASG